MRSVSSAVSTALSLVVLVQVGVLGCSSDAGDPPGGAAGAAGSTVAGSGGAASAGSSGAPAAGSGGAGTAGSAGAASAGAAGSAGGAGSSGGSGGAGGASAGAGGASGSSGSGSAGTGGAAPFALTSPSIMAKAGCTKDALAQCDRFGLDFCLQTIGGKNQSPELNWTAGPAGTLSYAMSLYDESNGFAHWVIWNIPGSTSKLPAMLAAGDSPSGVTGAKQLSFHQTGNLYAGPGANSHAYVFKLYALKTATFSPNIPAGNNKQVSVRMQLESSADVLAKVELRAASPQ